MSSLKSFALLLPVGCRCTMFFISFLLLLFWFSQLRIEMPRQKSSSYDIPPTRGLERRREGGLRDRGGGGLADINFVLFLL